MFNQISVILQKKTPRQPFDDNNLKSIFVEQCLNDTFGEVCVCVFNRMR